MINLVRGDLRRIIRKKGFLIALIFIVLFVIVLAIAQRAVRWNGYAYIYSVQQQINLYNLILSALIFLAVYGDEFKAMAMTCAIGRGVSRNKLIVSKLIDNVILSALLYGILAVILVLLGKILGANMTTEETLALVLNMMIGAYKTIGFTTLASVVLFVNANVPLGLFILLILQLMMTMIFSTAAASSKLISRLHVDRWYYGGMADSGYSSIMLGMTGEGIFTLTLGFVLYVGIALCITIALFSKRELDF